MVDDLKESTNSKIEQMMSIQPENSSVEVKASLMKPPAIMNPPTMSHPQNVHMCIEEGSKVEEYLKNQGILENSL